MHCTVCVRSVPGELISGASARSRDETSSGRTYPQVSYLLSANLPPANPHEWPAASKGLKPTDLAAPYTSSSSITNSEGAFQQPPALSHELSPSPTLHSFAPHCLASYSPARPGKLFSSGKAPSSHCVHYVLLRAAPSSTAWILNQHREEQNSEGQLETAAARGYQEFSVWWSAGHSEGQRWEEVWGEVLQQL